MFTSEDEPERAVRLPSGTEPSCSSAWHVSVGQIGSGCLGTTPGTLGGCQNAHILFRHQDRSAYRMWYGEHIECGMVSMVSMVSMVGMVFS